MVTPEQKSELIAVMVADAHAKLKELMASAFMLKVDVSPADSNRRIMRVLPEPWAFKTVEDLIDYWDLEAEHARGDYHRHGPLDQQQDDWWTTHFDAVVGRQHREDNAHEDYYDLMNMEILPPVRATQIRLKPEERLDCAVARLSAADLKNPTGAMESALADVNRDPDLVVRQPSIDG